MYKVILILDMFFLQWRYEGGEGQKAPAPLALKVPKNWKWTEAGENIFWEDLFWRTSEWKQVARSPTSLFFFPLAVVHDAVNDD